MLLNNRAEKLLACQSKGPGAEVMWMHITHTYLVIPVTQIP